MPVVWALRAGPGPEGPYFSEPQPLSFWVSPVCAEVLDGSPAETENPEQMGCCGNTTQGSRPQLLTEISILDRTFHHHYPPALGNGVDPTRSPQEGRQPCAFWPDLCRFPSTWPAACSPSPQPDRILWASSSEEPSLTTPSIRNGPQLCVYVSVGRPARAGHDPVLGGTANVVSWTDERPAAERGRPSPPGQWEDRPGGPTARSPPHSDNRPLPGAPARRHPPPPPSRTREPEVTIRRHVSAHSLGCRVRELGLPGAPGPASGREARSRRQEAGQGRSGSARAAGAEQGLPLTWGPGRPSAAGRGPRQRPRAWASGARAGKVARGARRGRPASGDRAGDAIRTRDPPDPARPSRQPRPGREARPLRSAKTAKTATVPARGGAGTRPQPVAANRNGVTPERGRGECRGRSQSGLREAGRPPAS